MSILRPLLFLAAMTSLLATLSAPAAAEPSVPVPPVPTMDRTNADRYGTQLARYWDLYDSQWKDQYSKGDMTLFDARGDKVRRKFTQLLLEKSAGDKSLVRFLAPAEIRGVSALIHEHHDSVDDSWLYLPSSNRVRRISGANRTASFQGTEFTYEDLSSLVIKRYEWSFVRDDQVKRGSNTEPVRVLSAKPTYRDTGYSKLLVHLHRDAWRVERIEYFDKAGRKLKVLDYGNWKHVHGRFWRATRLDMNNLQTRKRTLLDIGTLFVDLARYPKKDGSVRANLTDAQLSRRALEK